MAAVAVVLLLPARGCTSYDCLGFWFVAIRCCSDALLAVIANRDEHIVHAGISSILSMIIGLLALVACVILVVVLVRYVFRTYRHCDQFHHAEIVSFMTELSK